MRRCAVLLIASLGASLSFHATRLRAQPPQPALGGPLADDAKPLRVQAGPFGPVDIDGVASYFAQLQSSVAPGDRRWQSDLSNGQLFLNRASGLWQYFVQVGAYSLPALGAAYLRAGSATQSLYGPLPQAFLKLAPSEHFSIEAGKLPTLIGAEYTFSFENMNIERGLLWNQENAVNRGIQVNGSAGPLSLAASWNDGMYSNRFDWLTFSASVRVNKTDTVTLAAGGATRRETVSSAATPPTLNNQRIVDLIYARSAGPWTLEPYLQFTRVPSLPQIGALQAASTYGAALLVNYSFAAAAGHAALLANVNLPVRVEYIHASGSVGRGAPNLLYGPGSSAWSATVTPTYQQGRFFARAELSIVSASGIVAGMALGPSGTDRTQARFALETGLLF